LVGDSLSENDRWNEEKNVQGGQVVAVDEANRDMTCLKLAKLDIKDKILEGVKKSTTNDKIVLIQHSRVITEGENYEPTVYSKQPPTGDEEQPADAKKDAKKEARKKARHATLDQVEKELKNITGTRLHLEMEKGLVYVKNYVKNIPSGRVVVHIYS